MSYRRQSSMLIKLIEIYNKRTFASNADGKVEEYSLREVFVNPEHVVCMRENDSLKTRLSETTLGREINAEEGYTKIYINRGQTGLDLDVVGAMSAIKNKLLGRKN
jgi:hypothetical protein|tara:strand:- start:3591 stop:3908 length:318 start_codon:yes stop_codon:yes gene_type:complete